MKSNSVPVNSSNETFSPSTLLKRELNSFREEFVRNEQIYISANALLNFTGVFHTRWQGRSLIRWTEVTLVHMYNFVFSPNHIFVGCQHTTIKVSKRFDFKAHFPEVSIIFLLLVSFKSWQNSVEVDDRVLMDSDTIFVCAKL